MRYISPADVEQAIRDADPDWFARAKQAMEEVEGLPPANVSAAINEYDAIWRDLKRILREVGARKCWYCESREERSDNAVDHFRPKNRVAESAGHPGYWWLAFRWENFRFSCTYCNSRRRDVHTGTLGGKHDHFPILDEARRARTPSDDWESEQPLLLDPTRMSDPQALWFDPDGRAVPNPRIAIAPDTYVWQQSERSIDLYHLNHTDIVERRVRLFVELENIARKGDTYLKRWAKGDLSAKDAFEDMLQILRSRIRDDAEDSRAARSMLMGLRGTSVSAETALTV